MHLRKSNFRHTAHFANPYILEYASEVWDPSSRKLEQQIEAVQRKAVRFIEILKGRRDSVTENSKLLDNRKSMSAIIK